MNILAVMKKKGTAAARNLSFLKEQGHDVVSVTSLARGLRERGESMPDCVVVERQGSLEDLEEIRRQLAAGFPDATIPVVVAEEDNSWRVVVNAIARIWEGEETKEGIVQPHAAELTTILPSVLILSDRGAPRRALATRLSNARWRVLETSDVRRATLALLDEPIACILMAPELRGESNYGVICSVSVIRAAHPRPFSILVLTEREEAATLEAALENGADDVLDHSVDDAVLNRRLRGAVVLQDLRIEVRALKEEVAALRRDLRKRAGS
jgi:DNA-binding response OmpR family regulator